MLAVAIAAGLASCSALARSIADNPLYAAFNPAFIHGNDVDLSRFEHGNPVAPGSYRVDVYVNQVWNGRQEIQVRDGETPGVPSSYCFNRSQLAGLGLDIEKLPDASAELEGDDGCLDIGRLVPEARVNFDLGELRIDLSIPQAYLSRIVRGYADPRDWDRGVTAAFVDYNANAYRNDNRGSKQTQYYAGLNAGLNLGDWRLRHNGSYNQSSGDQGSSSGEYSSISSYAQRDISSLKSQLTVGEYYTSSELFDSVPYTGVQLASDDRMLPDSQRGFAPAIRGTAETNAKVTVRQGDNVLYETNVAPGPFIIDDLYSTGYAGDLEVTVSEADGRSRTFTVPFASVAQMLRPGVSRYSVVAGQYRNDDLDDAPHFVQGTYQRGIGDQWTGYTGSIIAEQYMAVQGGLALSTSLGAVAVDVTHSQASGLPGGDGLGESASGQSYRISYSKLVEPTGTNFVVAAHRFSSEGYLNLADYAQLSSSNGGGVLRQRNRLQINVSQPLDGFGNLFLSGSAQNYWNASKGSDMSYQAGYSNSFRWGSFNLSASRTRDGAGESETRYMLSLSMPLGSSPRAPYLNSSTSWSDSGDANAMVSVSGTHGDRSQLSYGVYGARSHSDGENSDSGGANLQYHTAKTNISASVSGGEGYHQLGLGLTGSVVVHPGGVSFSQSQGETRVVVEAKGADGARLLNSSVGTVDGGGYGVVAGLMPYRQNEVALDPKGTSTDVELQTTSQNVAPRYGAVVMLKYPTVIGQPLLLTLRDEAGKQLPVGADVLDGAGNSLAMVGQGSRVFLRSEERQGHLQVRWGEGPDRQCQVNYQLPGEAGEDTVPFLQAEAVCTKRPGRTELARR
ncbi:fimbria/pilus outer membrane usher protein [Zestomonas carbonaria]|uniref:fimbria/pilus outer membrane usher protein n=1 Tax=Zestomonas carbonaria TaxID=2762745 RepID=UPI001F1A33B9|nr:fimbria/pilus outer membrane usher protein [Pseudomonas carbonaria]